MIYYLILSFLHTLHTFHILYTLHPFMSNEEKLVKAGIKKGMINELTSQFIIKYKSTNGLDNFLRQEETKLNGIVNEMYSTYDEDNELEDLKNPELDWYREFLYDTFTDLYDVDSDEDE